MKKETYLAQVYPEVMTSFSEIVKVFNSNKYILDAKERFARDVYVLLVESGLYEYDYMFEAQITRGGIGMLMIRPVKDGDLDNDNDGI